jgi:uncharacterized membrane protein
MLYAAAYAGTFVVFAIADILWLGSMVNRLYRPTLSDILLAGVNLRAVIVFYILFPIGLMIFAVIPALKSGSVTDAVTYGALFGFFAYATYDLTNLSTLRNWTAKLAIVDMIWGTVLCAMAAVAGFVLATKVVGI